MVYERVTINLGTSLLLREVILRLLYVDKEVEGKKVTEERNIPFRLKYRLTRTISVLDKDFKKSELGKNKILAKYGELNQEGTALVVPEDKMEAYKKEIYKLFEEKVTHSLQRVEPEDLVEIEDYVEGISQSALALFIAYMTNDEEFLKDFENN